MSRFGFERWVVIALCACAPTTAPAAPPSSLLAAPSPAQAVSSAQSASPTLPSIDFALHGLADAGCFLLRDVGSGLEQVSSSERCAAGRRPNSTFKIANALIGADLGMLTSPDALMKWDAARYPKQAGWPEGWDRDQPLREAMRISAVPLFRKLALDIGEERMAAYLSKLEYGNRDMSGALDSFWLMGGLRITPSQQVDLISKLVRDELPVSKQAQATVREVLKKEPIQGAAHNSKTGTGKLESLQGTDAQGPMVGWMVGWIELARGAVAYAMWVEAPDFESVKALRQKTVDGVLAEVVQKWQ